MQTIKPFELDEGSDTYLKCFAMRSKFILNGEQKDPVPNSYDEIYEPVKSKLFETQTYPTFIVSVVIGVEFMVVMRNIDRLTNR